MKFVLSVLAIVTMSIVSVFYGQKLLERFIIEKNIKDIRQQRGNVQDWLSVPLETQKLMDTSNCKEMGRDTTTKYFSLYTVKKGDTLLSIAKDQLGSTSEVQDLIDQNKTDYPSISLEKPFVEVGWVLKIRRQELNAAEGRIWTHAGIVIKKDGSNIFVYYGKGFDPEGYKIDVNSIKLPQYIKDFKVGDCVYVVDDSNFDSHTPLIVELQQP